MAEDDEAFSAAACALLCAADPEAPLPAAALAALQSMARAAAPAETLSKQPLLLRCLGALATRREADDAAQRCAMQALCALLAAAPRSTARAAAAELHATGALAAACNAVAAPLELNVAAMALVGACAAAAEAEAPHAAAVRELLTAPRTLLALVCALGGSGEPRAAASSAACLAALVRAFGASFADALCLPTPLSQPPVALGAALPLLLALAAHPDEAPQRVLEGRCAAGAGVGGAGAAARSAACDALHACFAASPDAVRAAGAHPGAVASLLRAAERAAEGEQAPASALLALLTRSPAACADVAREPSLAVRLARLAASSSPRAASARLCLAALMKRSSDPACLVAVGAMRSVPGCDIGTMPLPSPLEDQVGPAFAVAVEAETKARRAAAKRATDVDAQSGAVQRASLSYDGRHMRASVEVIAAVAEPEGPGSAPSAELDAATYRQSFVHSRAHVALQRAALIAAWGAETPSLAADADVVSFGMTTLCVSDSDSAPCYAHTLGLGLTAGMGGELLVRTDAGAWMAPLVRCVADAGGAELLSCASGLSAAPLYSRSAVEFALPEARAGVLATLYAGLGEGAVPAHVAAATEGLTWRFCLPASAAQRADAELLTQTRRAAAPGPRLQTTAAGAFYIAYGGVPHRELYRLGENTQVCDADACIAAAGPLQAQTLRAALRALLLGGDADDGHAESCDCARCAEARALGAMCARPGCGVRVRLRSCGGCGLRAYCTPEHHAADWARHKPECLAARGKLQATTASAE